MLTNSSVVSFKDDCLDADSRYVFPCFYGVAKSGWSAKKGALPRWVINISWHDSQNDN